MNEKDYIDANNVLRDKLTAENEAYYDVILVHVRSYLRKDTSVAEDALLQVLQDLLDAQANGVTAFDYFGRRAQDVAKEIVDDLPDLSWVEVLKNYWWIPLVFALSAVISDVVSALVLKVILGHAALDLGSILLVAGIGLILSPLFVSAAFAVVHRFGLTWKFIVGEVLVSGAIYGMVQLVAMIPWHWYVNF